MTTPNEKLTIPKAREIAETVVDIYNAIEQGNCPDKLTKFRNKIRNLRLYFDGITRESINNFDDYVNGEYSGVYGVEPEFPTLQYRAQEMYYNQDRDGFYYSIPEIVQNAMNEFKDEYDKDLQEFLLELRKEIWIVD